MKSKEEFGDWLRGKTDKELQYYNHLLEALIRLGPIDQKLSEMRNKDIANILMEEVLGELNFTDVASSFIAEVIERLLLDPERIRGNEIGMEL